MSNISQNPGFIIRNGETYYVPVHAVRGDADEGADRDGEVWRHASCGDTTPIGSEHCVNCGTHLRTEFNVLNNRTETRQEAPQVPDEPVMGRTTLLDSSGFLMSLLGIGK